MTALINIKSLALLAWALVNTALGLAIGNELGWGEARNLALPVPVVQPAVPIEITLPPDYRLPALEKTYPATLERPLFVPSRQPVPRVPPPPPPPPPSMQKGQFQLLGSIIIDDVRIAVVKEVSSGKERQVFQGYTINGLQLELVEADRIVFTQYGDREEIRLKIQRSPKPVAKAVSAPAGGQPVEPQAAQLIPQQPVRRSPGWGAKGTSSGPTATPIPMAAPPQSPPKTMEDRKRDPLLKDFYK